MELRKDLQEIDIDSMTPEIWNSLDKQDRRLWKSYWANKGHVSFCCLRCGFPTAYGTVGCEACRPIK